MGGGGGGRGVEGSGVWGEAGAAGGKRLRVLVYFFFSSRRRHTRLQGDWSSDVCSSDLSLTRSSPGSSASWRAAAPAASPPCWRCSRAATRRGGCSPTPRSWKRSAGSARSEERRVGKEGRSRWSPYH